jgi:uncharacterized protein YggE
MAQPWRLGERDGMISNRTNTMNQAWLAALFLGASFVPAAVNAQQAPAISQTVTGTRLDLNVTGESTRVPDVAIISTGVVTRSTTASGAIQQAATSMARVRSALKAAGIADRDIQTSNLSLNPEYRYVENQPPQLTGYSATNQLTVRFRDIAQTGKVIDALVREGANQINGPSLTIDKPEAALDEARANAVVMGRARAELYARSLGLRIVRVVSVSESGGGYAPPPPMPYGVMAARAQAADSKIDAGEQKLSVTLGMVFELQ